MSSVRGARDAEARSKVEMVSIWITLDDRDLKSITVPADVKLPRQLVISKTLAGRYIIRTIDGAPLIDAIIPKAAEHLLSTLNDLRARLNAVYCGQVKRSPSGANWYGDGFVFLQAQPNEPASENLYLNENSARSLWGSIRQGVWLQVGSIANDPLGRNRRALNVGLKEDLDTPLGKFIEAVESRPKLATDALQQFRAAIQSIPQEHPIRAHVTDKVLEDISAQATAAALDQGPLVGEIEGAVLGLLPEFVNVTDIEGLPDHIEVASRTEGKSGGAPGLFDELLTIVELNPQQILAKNHAERIQLLREKSNLLSRRLGEYWPRALEAEFDYFDRDTKLGVALTAQGSLDPPSRRSHGLRGFLSLYAKLSSFSKKVNSVLLLDDPAIHLHPVAQRKMTSLLSTQQFQIIIATHLPFLIDPEHLERVRVFVRSAAGSQYEPDWERAQNALIPVWGAFLGSMVVGRIWLLVEGTHDRLYYEAGASLSLCPLSRAI